MHRKPKPTSDANEIMDRRYYEGRPDRIAELEEARANARLVGTTASVICLLEDAEYRGHSLSMLRRITKALNRRVEIRFVPLWASS
jgi:hypothetical protein